MYGTNGDEPATQGTQIESVITSCGDTEGVPEPASQESPKSLRDVARDLIDRFMDPDVFNDANDRHTRNFFSTAVAEYQEMVVANIGRPAGEQPAEAYGWMIRAETNEIGRTIVSRTSPIGVMRILRTSRGPVTIDDITQRLSEGVGYRGDAARLRGYVVAQVATIVNNAYGEDNSALRSHLKLSRNRDDAPTISFIP